MFATPLDRRRLLQAVSAGVMGYGLPEWLALEAKADISTQQPQAKQVLVVYEEGGISQMDTWDPKPDAPVDHCTPYKPIATNVPGVQYSSLMPLLAPQADKLAVVRSMTTAEAPSHPNACKEFFKGYPFDAPFDFPDIGSVVTHRLGSDQPIGLRKSPSGFRPIRTMVGRFIEPCFPIAGRI